MLTVREKQIEDILSTNVDMTKDILLVQDNLSLIARQKRLPSGGILDLLFTGNNNLYLLELKIEPGRVDYCNQILQYKEDLIFLQSSGQLINLPINSYLLCPKIEPNICSFCTSNNIIPIEYSPYDLLKQYYFRVKAISSLIQLKPKNHGLWNIYLLNRILYELDNEISVIELSNILSLSISTINSYLRLSTELGLTDIKPQVSLTKLGNLYILNRDKTKPIEFISDNQCATLSDFIKKNPFFSSATYGIYTVVESVFTVSKNYYPVPFDEAKKFFVYLSGKHNEWAQKAATDAFSMYSNYSIELGLLAKFGKEFYITPSGIRFILLLELNKSILFVESL